MPPDAAQSAPHDEDPADLLDRVAAGDGAARTRFFDAHAPVVDRFVRYSFGLCYDDAADVVQETMITAFKILANFDRHRPVANWLCGIAAKKVKGLRRSQARLPTPWSTLVPQGRGSTITPDAPSERAVEVALGERAASPVAEDGVPALPEEQPAPGKGRRTPPPGPPHADGAAPHAAWGHAIGTWLAAQPKETQIIARRFTHDASYEQLAADLSECAGKPVAETAVRQRASRFARDFADRFGQVLPRSRVRLAEADDARPPTGPRQRLARAGSNT